MEDIEFEEWLKSVPGLELASLVESWFSLEFLKCDAVREAIISLEQDEELERIESLSDEEVFTKYMGFNELLGNPVNLSDYLAERREWEYDSQGDIEYENYFQKREEAMNKHALSLLEEYEKNNS